MADAPGVDEFLRLEEACQQLLDELTTLRKETVTFRDAHTTMSIVGERLGAFLEPAAEASRQLAESARALREIGTPELLAGQARHQEQIERVADLAKAQGHQLSALDEHVSRGNGTTQEVFRALEGRITQETSAMTDRLATTEQRLTSLDANLSRSTQTAATGAANTARTLKILGFVLAAVFVIQIVALVWLIKS